MRDSRPRQSCASTTATAPTAEQTPTCLLDTEALPSARFDCPRARKAPQPPGVTISDPGACHVHVCDLVSASEGRLRRSSPAGTRPGSPETGPGLLPLLDFVILGSLAVVVFAPWTLRQSEWALLVAPCMACLRAAGLLLPRRRASADHPIGPAARALRPVQGNLLGGLSYDWCGARGTLRPPEFRERRRRRLGQRAGRVRLIVLKTMPIRTCLPLERR
jgi:hypothetical protein